MPIAVPNQRTTFFAAVIFLFASAMLPARWATRISALPRTIVMTFTQPFTDFLGDYASGAARPDAVQVEYGPEEQLQRNYEAALKENQLLWSQLMRLQEEIKSFRFLTDEAKRYYITAVEFNLMPARVTNAYDKKLTISRGSSKAMREGMVATDGPFLVGQVVEVGSSYSTVELITAPGTELQARVIDQRRSRIDFDPENAPPGVVAELERIRMEEPKMKLVVSSDGKRFHAVEEKGQDIPIGSLVVLNEDGLWPSEAQGLFIGRVTEVTDFPDDPTGYYQVTVEPVRPLEYLDDVLIVTPRETE